MHKGIEVIHRSVSFCSRLLGLLVLAGTLAACQGKAASASGTSAEGGASGQAGGPPQSGNAAVAPVDLPASRADAGGDVNSMRNATKKTVSGGDIFIQDLYERPFNANTMDTYFPSIDIVGAQAYKDDTWGYAAITVAGTDSSGKLNGQYAVELDTNRDGRGDWLIKASSVTSTQWSEQGVQAFKDSDGDVGGSVPLVADAHLSTGDGYETLVFDQGKDNSSDTAWARIDPSDPKIVEIAFKLSLVGNPTAYALGAWAGTNIDPAMFDYNDHMTHAQAGSPNWGDTIYPLKDMAEIDNTCRLAVGFSGTSAGLGLCSVIQRQAGQGAVPPPPAPLPLPILR